MVREGSGVQFTPAAPLNPKEYWASDARLIQADLRFTTERNANVRANTHKIRTERSRPVLTKKGPPIYDGPFEFAAGQWQPTPQAFPTTFLALSKCRCNADVDDGLPTVSVDFPLTKKSTVPGANFARKGFPSARLLQRELRENHTNEPQQIMRRLEP